ncbi:chemotaxis protein CheB [Rhodanobacter sp. FW510-R12]|uniref:chemotaxis protein CheB n=1 Tax=unclassified Rhodanobacter TaxID=2621553 RepID=UPI0007A9BEBC|nr:MULTISPECIES: chemotaxis protein CheB [unclassified Rhodanobacter]KZC16762.1 chemotaxis protein CheB [Rhodanobacter sp. FW104-R8]KZC27723.1 chemotaxis protein CheB [Rhodanobacter sp. FW510-T8]KZC33797.1 chemotaxis protein CheB [Rhodanobacter sp. FW510-R10]
MTDTVPAVALLFDDTDLGGQLRHALHERGARIVHEGGVSSLSRELLQQVGADVLVVNLDDGADDALDRLYEVIDDDRPRVVFNDAQASRELTGWDRARWARHLAVKVMAMGDIDPPRPGDARGVETPAAVVAAEAAAEPAVASFVAEPGIDLPAYHDPDSRHEQVAAAESENLAAELEALLAAGEPPDDGADETGPGLRYRDDDELPPLHDGHFGESRPGPAAPTPVAAAKPAAGAPAPAFQLDHLQLSPLPDPADATKTAVPAGPARAAAAPAVRAPDNWALLDDDPPAAAPAAEKSQAAAFGIEKLSAADFLAPDIETVAPDLEPTMSLELVSMEEAIAPQVYEHDHAMVLDEFGSALSRIVLLGAATDGVDSVCGFLSALPATTRLTFLHTQHLGGRPDAGLVEKLAAHCALPVRLASQGSRVGFGEVLVVPAGQQVRLRRDGGVELQAGVAQEPSIDASLTMAAIAFGRDALAIVFAGRGNDAVAGAQAIHDRGGQVWVESSSGEHFADMVSGILAERLVSFSGTPPELAARLIEVFP